MKTFRIAYVVPGIGLKEDELARRREIANKIVMGRASVDIIPAARGPYSIENRVEEAYASSSYLPLIHSLTVSYDAFVVGCFGDPGLRAARELTSKPVVGPAEASLYAASQLGDYIAIVAPLRSTVKLIRDVIKTYGFEDRVVAIESVDIPVLEISRGKKEAIEAIAEKINTMADKSDAEVIVLGCMSMGFALVDDLVRDKVHLPVINPVKISLKTAEMFIYAGLSHSKKTYPQANLDKIKHLLA
jgi:allantoin racemase